MSESPDYMEEFNKIYEESKASDGGGGYETYQLKDHQGKHNIVRLVGAPRQCKRAWIETDNKKKIPFVYDKSSVLHEIISTVLAFSWVETVEEGTGKKSFTKEYKHKDKYGDVFFMVKQNGGTDVRDQGWEGSTFYPFNCIDRHDTWCKDNKHAKLFVKSKYDIGISAQAFASLKNDVIEDYGAFQDYDVDIKKIEKDDGKIEYVAKKADSDLAEYGSLVKVGPITPEEDAYEKYDLDKIASPSKASFILKFLKQKISRIDQVCGTRFIAKLEEQSAVEPKREQSTETKTSQTKTQPQQEKTSFVQTGKESPEGFSYDALKSAGWSDEQIHETYPTVLEKKKPVLAPPKAAESPKTLPPKPAAPPTPPSAPKPPSAPAPEVEKEEPAKVDGFGYEDMIGAGWTDEALLANPKYAILVQKKSSQLSQTGKLMPCTQCEKPFSITEEKCPYCGFKDVELS